MSKPTALVLGGAGFIGKNLVTFLVENDLCSKIRVVDKVLLPTAYLTARQQKAFDKVDFRQGNLVNPASIEKAFAFEDGVTKWDWVFNVAGETKYSQTDEVYNEKVFLLSVNCAKQAAKMNVGVFIETSTAQVYDADKKSSDESGKVKPWTLIAKYKLKAEEEIAKISGLNYVIVRPAIVYGVGDMAGLTPRIVIAAVYKELKEEMKFLWTKDLRINTVHVDDVVGALVAIAQAAVNSATSAKVLKQTFNLADKSDSDQESVNAHLRSMFGITTGYQGSIISNLARLNLKDITEEINDKHLQPWSDLCKRHGVSNSPLTPYLDQELLYNNSLSVDGSKVESAVGYKYKVPQVTEDKLREVVNEFITIGVFPKGIL
ncbi:hypothetical protein MIR68_005942 [Amoeboaphelidium protococcarum]|nr:hypothetical protein MIR68_005942 [Amoeboaphelidium protococcarum]